MNITSTRFIKSSQNYKTCPKPEQPEYAFIGRSNVGKSTLINMLTGKKRLAKTSSTPGKTQLINHFSINEQWMLADLPGYGYARISLEKKKGWDKMIRDYLVKRENLMTVFLLIDSRHEPQNTDLEFIDFLGINGIPFTLVYTKTDKLSGGKLEKNLNAYKNQLKSSWEQLPGFIVTSSLKKQGRDEVLNFIEKTNSLWEQK